jgi:hypothetical protein
MSVLVSNSLGNPALDVVPAEADVLADPETLRPGVAVPPRVDGLHWDLEIVGQLFDRQ